MVKTVVYPSDPEDSSHTYNDLGFLAALLGFRLSVPRPGTDPRPTAVKALSPSPGNSL